MNYIDAETKVIMNGVPFLSPADQARASAYAKERIQAFIAGVSRTPPGVNDFIRKESGDDRLQLRWCFDPDTYILERWQGEGDWLTVMVPLNKFNQTPHLSNHYLRQLVHLLKANDLTKVDVK